MFATSESPDIYAHAMQVDEPEELPSLSPMLHVQIL